MKRIAVAVALSLIALTSFAQQSETITVEVTNLDVVVKDGKGKPVTGLTRDDFEVLQDGKRMEISNLSEIHRGANTVTETMQPAPRRILLIVDNATIALAARRKVFDATRAALDRLILNSSDRVAIATLTRDAKQRLDWTSDREKVLQTLAEVEKDAMLPSPDQIAFERSLDLLMDEADSVAVAMGGGYTTLNPDGSVPTGGDGMGDSARGMGKTRARMPINFQQITTQGREYAASATNDAKRTLSSLSAAFNSFAAVPGGRKIAILVGGGLPLNAADAIFQRIESVRDKLESTGHRGFTNVRNASTLTQISAFDIAPEVDAVATGAKLKGVAVYAVNPEFGDRQATSARSRSESDGIAEYAVMRGMLDGYQRLASLTGGAALIGRPADLAVSDILSDLESYYSLGYRSDAPLGPKSDIVVKVRKGLTARTTISSGAVSRDWEVSDQVLANHMLEPANPMGVSVKLDPAVIDGDRKTIPMKVMIPVDSLKLIEDQGDYAASFAVFISLGDAEGNGSAPMRQEQSFRWPEAQVDQVKGKTIGFAVNIEVVGGERDRISVGVLDQYSGAAAYTRAMLE